MQALDIDYNELVSVLGEPSRNAGSQHYFQCPACAAGGGDTSRDNLLFNSRRRYRDWETDRKSVV